MKTVEVAAIGVGWIGGLRVETLSRTQRRRGLKVVVSDFLTPGDHELDPNVEPDWERSMRRLSVRNQVLAVEVVDPRTLVPMDKETLRASVRKTGRVVIVDEACMTCSAAAEIMALLTEDPTTFRVLKVPPKRVCAPDAQRGGQHPEPQPSHQSTPARTQKRPSAPASRGRSSSASLTAARAPARRGRSRRRCLAFSPVAPPPSVASQAAPQAFASSRTRRM